MNIQKFCRDQKESYTFEEAITLTGYGKFNLELTIICVLSIVAVGFQSSISSYIFPAAQCEFDLTTFETGLLNVAFLIGGTLSCFVWGFVADSRGRRNLLICTHFFNVLFTLVGSSSPCKKVLLLCRVINGFLIGGPGSIMFAFLSEFHAMKYSFRSVSILGLSFIGGWLLLPVVANSILNINVDYNFKNLIIINPWRIFLALITLPEILVCVWLTKIPESPKYCFVRGDPKKALAILKHMYQVNFKKSPDTFPCKEIICEFENVPQSNKIMVGGKTLRVVREIIDQIKVFFQKQLLKKTLLLCGIMFGNMFGLFGLGLWLPQVFIKFEKYHNLHPNSTVSLKVLSSIHMKTNNTCDSHFEPSALVSATAAASTAFVVNVLSCFTSTIISSKSTTIILTIIGGISAGCSYWLVSAQQYLALSCIFEAAMMTANMSITSLVVEQFPTNVAGIAVCLALCAGRLAGAASNVMFALLMDRHCEIPIFAVAVVQLVGGTLCMFLPSRPNQDDLEDSKNRNIVQVNAISSEITKL